MKILTNWYFNNDNVNIWMKFLQQHDNNILKTKNHF
ncbi:MAG: hypothetical protein JWQ34_2223 [Mucilaginibacter sp.]|nr:hypothetical protein [Mucilaginibacter sp.]